LPLPAALLVWILAPQTGEPVVPANPHPVIVFMDSPLEGRVYDPRTAGRGGTNADDITDALRGLPIVTHKENTSPMWHREEEVRQQNPDLIVSHLSCLFDQRVTTDAASADAFVRNGGTSTDGIFSAMSPPSIRARNSSSTHAADLGPTKQPGLVRWSHAFRR
jgi:hypothetical protein